MEYRRINNPSAVLSRQAFDLFFIHRLVTNDRTPAIQSQETRNLLLTRDVVEIMLCPLFLFLFISLTGGWWLSRSAADPSQREREENIKLISTCVFHLLCAVGSSPPRSRAVIHRFIHSFSWICIGYEEESISKRDLIQRNKNINYVSSLY
jgi:hypothetical protein